MGRRGTEACDVFVWPLLRLFFSEKQCGPPKYLILYPAKKDFLIFDKMLLLLLTFSALVASPKKVLYTVANPARGLLNREKKKKKVWQHPPPARCSFGEKKKKKKSRCPSICLGATQVGVTQVWSRSVSRPYKDSYDSSSRPMGVASQNSTLPCAIATVPVSLFLSSLGDVWPRLPLLPSTRP